MIAIRPTIQILKILNTGDRLSTRTKAYYLTAITNFKRNSEGDATSLLRLFCKTIDEAIQSNPLLIDATKRFSDGKYPDLHASSTKSAKQPIYEARDHTSPAWRAALIIPENTNCAWMIHADRHDRFHSSAHKVIKQKKNSGTLGPSKLDLRIKERSDNDREESLLVQKLYGDLIDALRIAINSSETQAVRISKNSNRPDFEFTINVDDLQTQNWNIENAHEETAFILVSLVFAKAHMHNWLLGKVIPFLQPDEKMIEPFYEKGTFKAQIIISKARFTHILAPGTTISQPKGSTTSPTPRMLHYAEKNDLVEAYVEGKAVPSVCGRWWVPIGDEQTHAELPVCPECEKNEPFAQFLKNIRKIKNS